MKHHLWYKCVWKVLRFVGTPFLRLKFNYTPENCNANGTLLVLCNHNTDWDPLLLGTAFPNYMSFVASEHIFRWGFLSKLINGLVAPIARLKGTTAVDTVRTIVRRLHDGVNVAMFAEGNRSWNGVTGEIIPSTGKLARNSGATLVTYRLHGGYFTSPRWSGSAMRKGKMYGEVVGVYTPEQLKAMTVKEVNETINRDLYLNAYEQQRREMIEYSCPAPAENLERLLCVCPKCGKVDTIKSSGNMINCECGFSAAYNKYGFLEGKDLPADNLTEWDNWQIEKLLTMVDNAGDEAIFTDEHMVLTEVNADHTTGHTVNGAMMLFRDRLDVCGESFALNEISGFTLHGPQTVNMSVGSHSYEISSQSVRCTRKYMLAIAHLKKYAKGEI